MKQILLASGDIFRARHLVQLLGDDYEVTPCNREGEAIEILTQEPADLAIIDSRLKAGESVSLVERISDSWPDTPVLMLVQSEKSSLARKGRGLGIREVIKIPFTDKEMLTAVETGLEMGPGPVKQSELEAPRPPIEPEVVPEPKPVEAIVEEKPIGVPTEPEPIAEPDIPEAVQREAGEIYLKALKQATDSLDCLQEPEQLYKSIVALLKNSLDVTNVTLLVRDQETERFRVGFSSANADVADSIPQERGLIGWMTRHNSFIRLDKLQFNSPEALEVYKDLDSLNAVIAFPLLNRNRLIGIAACGSPSSGEPFTQNDLALLTLLSSFLGGIMGNSLIFEEAVRERDLASETVREPAEGVIVVDDQKRIVSINDNGRVWEPGYFGKSLTVLDPDIANLLIGSEKKKETVSDISYANPISGLSGTLRVFHVKTGEKKLSVLLFKEQL